MSIIYQIRNLLNDKVYIGSTKRKVGEGFNGRKAEHLYKLRRGVHHSSHLQRAFIKYGEDNFRFEVLYECSNAVIWQAEQDEIDLYLIDGKIDRTRCYNNSRTTFYPSSTKGTSFSKERKFRMKWTQERKDNLSRKFSGQGNPFYGKTHSEKTLEIISKVHKGWKHTDESKQMMSEKKSGEGNGFYGRKHTDETRTKMKKAWTEERKIRMKANHPMKIHKMRLDAKLSANFNE